MDISFIFCLSLPWDESRGLLSASRFVSSQKVEAGDELFTFSLKGDVLEVFVPLNRRDICCEEEGGLGP